MRSGNEMIDASSRAVGMRNLRAVSTDIGCAAGASPVDTECGSCAAEPEPRCIPVLLVCSASVQSLCIDEEKYDTLIQ